MRIPMAVAACLLVAPLGAALGLQAQSQSANPNQPERIYAPGNGVTPPVLIREVRPTYSPAGLPAGIHGAVAVEAIVQTDGAVGDVKVVRSLDRQLDALAIAAARQWRFVPSRLDGRPVPVRITILIEFPQPASAGDAEANARPIFTQDIDAVVMPDGTVQRIYQPGGDVSFPRAAREIRPDYTPEALRARVQGEVEVEAVVLPDGSVDDVRVVKSLDRQFGLDDQAVAAARLWRFEPSRLAGQPVPVRITIVLEFRTGEDPSRSRPGSSAARVAAARTMTAEEFSAGASREGQPGVVAPQVARAVSPSYTLDAFRRGVEGTVGVDVVVMPDGTVSRARVAASLDDQPRGLDDGALDAAFRWRFVPSSGTVSGRPAPVIVRLNLEYKVR